MKKMFTLVMMMVITVTTNAMSYNAAKNEALFLSDKMAYELNLTAAQYEDVYEINLDYLMSVNGHADVFGPWWNRRNADLRYVLTPWQYDKYVTLNYFYRPVAWEAGGWTFAVYSHYGRGHFYKAHPKVFVTYKGGNNHKHDRFYADRHVSKPGTHHGNPTAHHGNPTAHHGKPVAHNDKKPWRNTSMNNGHGPGASNHPVAHNTNGNHNNGHGHFEGRR